MEPITLSILSGIDISISSILCIILIVIVILYTTRQGININI